MQLKREKEAERERIARDREDRLAQQELERERERLEKEHAHYSNVLEKLQGKGDEEGAQRMQEKLADVSARDRGRGLPRGQQTRRIRLRHLKYRLVRQAHGQDRSDQTP
jgi:hypothetical protein